MIPLESNPGGQIDDHLQRALIEIYYAMAECSPSQAPSQAPRQRPGAEAAMRERLVIIMASIEDLMLMRLQAFKEKAIPQLGPSTNAHN